MHAHCNFQVPFIPSLHPSQPPFPSLSDFGFWVFGFWILDFGFSVRPSHIRPPCHPSRGLLLHSPISKTQRARRPLPVPFHRGENRLCLFVFVDSLTKELHICHDFLSRRSRGQYTPTAELVVTNVRHSWCVGDTAATIHAHENHGCLGLLTNRVWVQSTLEAGAGTRDGFVEEPRIQFEIRHDDIRSRGAEGSSRGSAVVAEVRGAPERRAADVEVLLNFAERVHTFHCGTAKVVGKSIAQSKTIRRFVAGIEGPDLGSRFGHDSRHDSQAFSMRWCGSYLRMRSRYQGLREETGRAKVAAQKSKEESTKSGE